jgi:hypothetical protein
MPPLANARDQRPAGPRGLKLTTQMIDLDSDGDPTLTTEERRPRRCVVKIIR